MLKTIFLLVILLFFNKSLFSQDTIINYVDPECLGELYNGYHVEEYMNKDSIFVHIEGFIDLNCGGTHLAFTKRISDTLFVTSIDTGRLANCICVFHFSLSILELNSDSILVFNGKSYRLKGLIDNVGKLEKCNLELFPNPFEDYIQLKIDDNVKIARVSVSNIAGKIVKIINPNNLILDLSDIHQGFYIVDIETTNNKHFFRKVLKK